MSSYTKETAVKEWQSRETKPSDVSVMSEKWMKSTWIRYLIKHQSKDMSVKMWSISKTLHWGIFRSGAGRATTFLQKREVVAPISLLPALHLCQILPK